MTIKELNSERTRDGYILITYRDSLGYLYKQKYSGYSIHQAKRLFIDKYSGILAI